MAMSAVYTTVGGELLSEVRGGAETLYVPDTLGSLVQARSSAGAEVYEAEYWPYGEVQSQTGANPSPWGFVGLLGYLTDVADLLYVRARHYRAGLMRWMTVDPLWPGQSAYGYVAGQPVSQTDPSGLMLLMPFPPYQLPPYKPCRTHPAFVEPLLGFYLYCPVCLKIVKDHVAQQIGDPSGPGNALRHCIGACEANRKCGSGCAPFIGLDESCDTTASDILACQISGDTLHDVHNNEVGFTVARSNRNCFDGCAEELQSGHLWF